MAKKKVSKKIHKTDKDLKELIARKKKNESFIAGNKSLGTIGGLKGEKRIVESWVKQIDKQIIKNIEAGKPKKKVANKKKK